MWRGDCRRAVIQVLLSGAPNAPPVADLARSTAGRWWWCGMSGRPCDVVVGGNLARSKWSVARRACRQMGPLLVGQVGAVGDPLMQIMGTNDGGQPANPASLPCSGPWLGAAYPCMAGSAACPCSARHPSRRWSLGWFCCSAQLDLCNQTPMQMESWPLPFSLHSPFTHLNHRAAFRLLNCTRLS